jgi:hypothetical protein
LVDPSKPLILGIGGFVLPPSPPHPSPPASGGESFDQDSSSYESSQTSNTSQNPALMANQNNPTRPCLDQDVVVVLGPKHTLPKNPKKWSPKFDPDSKQSTEDHIKKSLLVVRLKNFEHKDVICIFFPYTFEGNASTWYFTQQPQTIVS